MKATPQAAEYLEAHARRNRFRRVLNPETEQWIADHVPDSYWTQTQRPIAGLLIVLPAILIYESAVQGVGGFSINARRSGADAWMRSLLASVGLDNSWFLPSTVLAILVCSQIVSRQRVRISLSLFAGMLLESIGWAIALVGLSRLVDAAFSYLEHHQSMVLSVSQTTGLWNLTPLVGYLGAGIYEETLFRLTLIPLLYTSLKLLQMPQVMSSSLAVTASSLLFAAAHHAGSPAEAFTWFAFIFRWMAGVLFAWIFILRGFGIAVGSHIIYDTLVGWVGWEI